MKISQEMESCIECQSEIIAADILRYGDLAVCVCCKETLLDKLKLGLPPGSGPWRGGHGTLVLPLATPVSMPSFCLKCGCPSREEAFIEELQWNRPLSFVVFGYGCKLKVAVPLCAEHQEKRHYWRKKSWAVLGLMILFASAGVILQWNTTFVIFGAGALGIAAIAMWRGRVLSVQKSSTGFVHVHGAGSEFLQRLTPFQPDLK
ncbi:MAG: hypothetical protein KDN22_04180 [Verrucomicrobiae bacterium]|nr:hypothetical protein [Verrucomicrobiae bacterium]